MDTDEQPFNANLENVTRLVFKWASICEKYGAYMLSPLNEPQLVGNDEEVSKWAQELLPQDQDFLPYKGEHS